MMQKLPILLILFCWVLLSCQPKTPNATTTVNTNSIENVNKTEEIQTSISPTPVPNDTFDIHSKIGIADVRSEGSSCLRTKNANLLEKTPISIVISLDEPPQKVLTAAVEKKLEKSCARRASETGDNNPGEDFFYSLILTENSIEEIGFDVGIAVIQPTKQIQVRNNLANVDLNEDGNPEFFRRCSGFEGMHFTIWTGNPLKGKRIWHSFYYLDYDTEVNCKKKDWEGTDEGAD
ncbi:MAG: hypothetical protein WBD16_02435 [Pyrinomonadaceae bacterium]